MGVDVQDFWIASACIGAGVFAMRFSFIWLMDKLTMPPVVLRLLRFIPCTVLPALVLPAVVYHGAGTDLAVSPGRMAAAFVAILVSWRTRNMLATIASGMATLWTIQALMG
ncbi:MAG: AzlD domain-containing protein [Desulfovibrionaceae bacterium]